RYVSRSGVRSSVFAESLPDSWAPAAPAISSTAAISAAGTLRSSYGSMTRLLVVPCHASTLVQHRFRTRPHCRRRHLRADDADLESGASAISLSRRLP